jgi:hypothetical protein
VAFGLPDLGFPALNRGVPDLIAPVERQSDLERLPELDELPLHWYNNSPTGFA